MIEAAIRGCIRLGGHRPLRGVAAVCAALSAGPANADDRGVSTLIFGSLDAAPSAFATGGFKIAFDRIDREGFAVLASAGAGIRSERGATSTAPVPVTRTRQTVLGAALMGYQWVKDWGVVAAYVGPEASIEALSDAGLMPVHFGLRLHGEVWARPSEGTLVTATAILGSTRGSAWSRLAWGSQLWGAYIGPEGSVYIDETGYRKWGLGLHATDFSIGRISFRASAGYQIEAEAKDGGPYVALSIWTPL